MQKPRLQKNSKFNQGIFTPTHPEKYIGKYPIIYRSSYEAKFARHLDLHPDVLRWASEIPLKYRSSLDNSLHTYFIDFYVETKIGDKIIKRFIEVKPFIETQFPVLPKSGKRTRVYLNRMKTYQKNLDKWKYAAAFAKSKGILFEIFDEYRLGIKKRKNND